MEFERARKRKRAGNLPLIPLIDVMFILIIFFMLTTTFMRVESLELMLPSVSGKAAEKSEVMHLFIQADGDMLLGTRKLDQDELNESLKRMFDKDANTKVMLLSADGVTMQQLVGIMDKVYLAGGRSLFVRKWDAAPPAAKEPAPAAAVAPTGPTPHEPAKPVILQ